MPDSSPAQKPVRFVEVPISLGKYTEAYSISRNPFGIASILPLLVVAFLALAVGITITVNLRPQATTYINVIDIMVGLFTLVTTGLLLIPAVVLRGSLIFDDEGIRFLRGKDEVSATWEQVIGLSNHVDCGLCLELEGAKQSRNKMKMAGGFRAEAGRVALPIRFFGDRRFAILYEVRDRLPESAWLPALSSAKPPSSKRTLVVYSLACGASIGAVLAVFFSVSP